MKNDAISARRQLLARKNYGRRQMREFLSNLSLALSQDLRPDNLLSLEETDGLHRHYTEYYELAIKGKVEAYRRIWPSGEKNILELKLICFKEKAEDDEVILFTRGFDYCGALKLKLHRVLDHIFELLLIDKDSVLLLGKDGTNAFMLEVYEDGIEGYSDEAYELVIWGDFWLNAINMC